MPSSSRVDHNRTFSNEENMLEEDGDEVFSNPDTAELESSRSDATGATSPTPNSPGPSSPSYRAASHVAIVASQYADPFGSLKQPDYQTGQPKQQSASPMTLANMPNTKATPLDHRYEQNINVETPRANQTPNEAASRPQFGRTLSASGATTHSAYASMNSASLASRIVTPRMGGHATSHSASYLNLSMAHGQPLPSAHDMPSDPREAYTLSKLFARPPAQSPSEEISGFGLGVSDTLAASLSRQDPDTPVAASAVPTPLSSRLRSRPTTRPSSPDHASSPSRAAVGPSVTPKVHADAEANDPSIFERDIEHRDAGHVLSKQEAQDVAIPSVLDDAVEAITYEDADQLEIVAPHAAPPPLALSAQALSAHSHSQGQLQSLEALPASSPAPSLSPPLSSLGGVGDAPPGSIAAQIAERLASKMGSSGAAEEATATSTAPSPNMGMRHRRPNSDVSVSSSSSMRSRSPQVPLSIGVQQVLDASNSPPANSTSALRSISASPAVAHSKSPSLVTTPRSGSTSYANLASMSQSAAPSPKPLMPLPTATALPSLPLPNPYRSHSPSASTSPLPDGGMPMLSSMSMDGAVMATGDSATMDASLDGLADVIASSQTCESFSSSRSNTMAMSSPASLKIKGLGLDEDLGPYSSRSPMVSNSTSPRLSDSVERSVPGGFALGLEQEGDPMASPQMDRSGAASSLHAKKRLSFFRVGASVPAQRCRAANDAPHNRSTNIEAHECKL